MPLTEKGRRRLKDFIKRYNSEKGKRIFYAYMGKHKKRTGGWHK